MYSTPGRLLGSSSNQPQSDRVTSTQEWLDAYGPFATAIPVISIPLGAPDQDLDVRISSTLLNDFKTLIVRPGVSD